MSEGVPGPIDIEKMMRKALAEKTDFDDLIFSDEKAVTASDLEEAFRFEVLHKDGKPLKAEGDIIRSSEGRPKLTLPHPDLIRALHAADNRIESFDRELLKFNEDGQFSDWSSNAEVAYNTTISTPLAASIMKDFPDEKVLLARGIAASINGAVYDGNTLLVRDIRQVLQLGDEHANGRTLLASVGHDSENIPTLHYRINQYLVSGQSSMRRRLPAALRETIFPVLLMYDKSKVSSTGGHYDHALPLDATERSTCIVKAYILPRSEF